MKKALGIIGLGVSVLLVALADAPKVSACGGFFCQQIPINQAAEQIIFRQDGNQITAVVLIQYVGEAEDFSWVLPVPGIPELSTGSDIFFQALEPATRPQFILEIVGEACSDFGNPLGGLSFLGSPPEAADSADDGVQVLQRSTVGPFDVLVVSSDDADAMAQWLEDNDFDLSDRGAELIEPYVTEGMNFVALKLQQNQGVGDIRPLIMKYQAEHAMIPLRLTAVAAQDDMGVLVWMLGAGRAIPLNYLHVVPNYTLLNWFQGTNNAYATYQGLVTAAMNEAGGQGFATDFAGPLDEFTDQIPSREVFDALLDQLQAAESAREFYEQLIFSFVIPSNTMLEILRRQLPLPEGVDEFVYNDATLLIEAVGEDAAEAARQGIVSEISEGIIEPLVETLEVLDGAEYMTRLFTTLSADEMTLDPTFSFNADLEDQPLVRNAKLTITCNLLEGTSWELELGEGTDRPGEVVLRGTGSPPFSAPVIDQPSVVRAEFLREASAADVEIDNSAELTIVDIAGDDAGGICGRGAGGCGATSLSLLLVGIIGTRLMRRRHRA